MLPGITIHTNLDLLDGIAGREDPLTASQSAEGPTVDETFECSQAAPVELDPVVAQQVGLESRTSRWTRSPKHRQGFFQRPSLPLARILL